MNQPDPEFRSVTLWLKELEQGSGAAANELWRRYFERLVKLAGKNLRNVPRRISDEEDVAINVFHSLCDGVENGRFDQLDDRDDLWKLLVVMTRHKTYNQIRHQTAKKRGGKEVRGHSILGDGSEVGGAAGFDVFFGNGPTPEFLISVQEEQERLVGLLSDASHRQIVQLRLQGYSVDETAEKMDISPRSVKRKLAIIREAWTAEFEQVSNKP